jgi:hypothetical protein
MTNNLQLSVDKSEAVENVAIPGFKYLLRAEWTRFRGRRGLVIGMVVAALLIVLPGMLIATSLRTSCEGPDGSTCPATPIGPGGEAVEDRFYFVHQPLTGDGSISVRIMAMSGIITYPPPDHDEIVEGLVPWAKAGIMIRQSTEQGSAYAAVVLTGSHGVRMQHNFTGDMAGSESVTSADSPRWLRLTRSGNIITGHESRDGTQWTEIDTVQLDGLPEVVQVGMFVTSPCDLTISEGACRFTQASADFDEVGIEGVVSGAWSQIDLGAGPMMTDWERYHRANGLVQSGDTFTVTGTGDIAPLTGGWSIERLLIGTVLGLIAVIVVAARFSTARVQSGPVLAARALVIGAVPFAAGLIAAAVVVLTGAPLLQANGTELLPVTPLTELRVILGTAALLAAAAIFTFALRILFRRSTLAVIVAIGLIVVPYILAISTLLPLEASEWLLRLTPAAGFAIQQSVIKYPQVIGLYIPLMGYYPLAPEAGFAVMCGYTALALGLAFVLRQRQAAAQ